MPTKRTRKARTSGSRINQDVLHLYRRGLPLHTFVIACIESNENCTHPECPEYYAISTELDRLLGLRPWLPSPLEENDDSKGWEFVGPIKAALDKALASGEENQNE